MKKHTIGFGIIMTIGLAIALVGSNPASGLLAEVLTTMSGNALAQSGYDYYQSPTTSTASSTTGVTTTSATNDSTATTASATNVDTQTTATAAPTEEPIIKGIQNSEVITGVRTAAVGVFGYPISVRAEVTLPTGAVKQIVATCPEAYASMTIGSVSARYCYFSIDTAGMQNAEGYRIAGIATYSSGLSKTTAPVLFAVSNVTATQEFTFIYPAAYAHVSGVVPIRGKIEHATGVEYRIFAQANTITPIVLGLALQKEGVWTYQWNTAAIAEGNYIIVPQIMGQAGSYRGKLIGVIVDGTSDGQTTQVSTAVEPAVQAVPTEAVVVPAASTVEPPRPPEVAPIVRPVPAPTPIVTPTPVEEKEPGFLQNVRDIYRSAITPKEDPARPIETLKPVIIGSEAVQRLEMVFAELKESSSGGGVIPQSAVNRIAKDTDGDSIPDYQEMNVLRTDPLKKDTDGDGIADGTEVRQGANPLNKDRAVKIQYENAKLLGETVRPEVLAINTVALATTTEVIEVETATTTAAGKKEIIKEKKIVVTEKIKFGGRALPYALVTIYIYSDVPTIVTVKADKDGNWSYALDKTLDDGEHQAYVTVNDSSGKIVAKSQALGFVKTAQAITVANIEGLAQAAEGETAKPVEESKRNFGLTVALVISIGLLIGIVLVVRSFKKPEGDIV